LYAPLRFCSSYLIRSSSTTFRLQTLDGGINPQNASVAGLEASLDIQYTVGLATNVPVTFLSIGENYTNGAPNGEWCLDTVRFMRVGLTRAMLMSE
jgi:tripeptidyl-peptidase-1